MDKFTVYSHVNEVTDVTYVGITKRTPEIRWANGFGYKSNLYFWRAIVKYGWDGFNHNILYTGLSKEEAIEIEENLIKHYKSPGLSYNISDGRDYVGKQRSKPVAAYTKSGTFIGTFNSIAEASREFNLSESGIYYCITMFNGTKYIGDYIFLYPESSINDRLNIIKNYKRKGHPISIENRQRIATAMSNRVISEETGEKMRRNNKGKIITPLRKVAMLSQDSKVIKVFNSIKEASEFVGKPQLHSKISLCCRGERNVTCGYKWKYLEDL